MAVECEWATHQDIDTAYWEIREDFEKLVVSRANLRCMIWDDRRYENVENLLRNIVRSYSRSQPGDRYLLAAYRDEGFRFWLLRGDGAFYRVVPLNH